MKTFVAATAMALALSGLMIVSAAAAGGPPPFLTFPILLHVGEDGLDHGHFVFAEEAATPAPLAPDLGAASWAAAAAGTSTLLSTPNLDVNVSNSPDSYEGETGATSAASVNGLLVAGSNHIYPGACNAGAASGTFGDCAPLAYAGNGTTFSRTALPRSWNNTTFGIGFDPSVDVDAAGTFYFSYGVAPLSGSYPNAIVVVKSTDGVTWAKAAPVTFNRNRAFDDKYYLAIDRSGGTFANRLYVSWDRNEGNNQTLYISYSSNGGASWSSPVKVNDGRSKFERVIGAYPAVNQSSGVVYDSWHDYAKNVIYVDRSASGGASWGTDVAAATTHAGFGQDIGCVGGRSQGPAHALKVGPSGTLYLVYADPVKNRGFDVLLTRSTNGGTSWSTPVSLNDDAGAAHQFHPTLSVESNGGGGDRVTVTFYDRRDDANNCLSHVYATQSTDNGTTWSANVRQTSEPSDFTGNSNGPGDYSSSAPGLALGGVFPFFADHRASNPQTAPGGGFDVYTVKVQ